MRKARRNLKLKNSMVEETKTKDKGKFA